MNIQHMTTNFDPQKQKLLGALSRPPKIELKGTLVPNSEMAVGSSHKFKLATDSREYFLSMSPALSDLAQKIEWETVTVKGYLDLITKEIEVEKMSLASAIDPPRYGGLLSDDVEDFRRTIEHEGKIELEDLAS